MKTKSLFISSNIYSHIFFFLCSPLEGCWQHCVTVCCQAVGICVFQHSTSSFSMTYFQHWVCLAISVPVNSPLISRGTIVRQNRVLARFDLPTLTQARVLCFILPNYSHIYLHTLFYRYQDWCRWIRFSKFPFLPSCGIYCCWSNRDNSFYVIFHIVYWLPSLQNFFLGVGYILMAFFFPPNR